MAKPRSKVKPKPKAEALKRSIDVTDLIQAEIERFARLFAVELSEVDARVGTRELSPVSKVWRAVDNALRRFKFEEIEKGRPVGGGDPA